MPPFVETRKDQIGELCRRCHVSRLDLFGSGATGAFSAETSDLDFVVEFEALDPVPYKNAFFDLLSGLETLFERPIDLVTARSLRNPYLIRAVNENRQMVYAA